LPLWYALSETIRTYWMVSNQNGDCAVWSGFLFPSRSCEMICEAFLWSILRQDIPNRRCVSFAFITMNYRSLVHASMAHIPSRAQAGNLFQPLADRAPQFMADILPRSGPETYQSPSQLGHTFSRCAALFSARDSQHNYRANRSCSGTGFWTGKKNRLSTNDFWCDSLVANSPFPPLWNLTETWQRTLVQELESVKGGMAWKETYSSGLDKDNTV
jgi:hypothetical protein